jgi:TetR/AcrR family transcriptional regulator
MEIQRMPRAPRDDAAGAPVRALEARRQAILEAAEQVFARSGYDRATMAEIAGRAGYSAANLYNLFESKQDLFRALFEERGEEFRARMRQALAAGPDPRRAIDRAFDSATEYALANRDLFLIYIRVTQGFEWKVRQELGEQEAARHRALVDDVARVFERGIREGQFAPGDARLYALAMFGAMTSAYAWLLENEPPDRLAERWYALREMLSRLWLPAAEARRAPAGGVRAGGRR